MNPICFVINPVAGTGSSGAFEHKLSGYLDQQGISHEIRITRAAGEAKEIALEAVERKLEKLVVAGGDGTVNEVVNAAVNTHLQVGIIPRGSGNGIARHFNIPLKAPGAVKALLNGRSVCIDTVQVNDQYFAGFSGVGFDALVAERFSRQTSRGFYNYIKLVVNSFAGYKPQQYQLGMEDGSTRTVTAFLVAVANTGQYGNNAFISPHSDPLDGRFEIVIVKPFPPFSSFGMAKRLFTRGFKTGKHIEVIPAKEVTIKQAGNLCHIDGDPKKPGNILHYRINPKSLHLLIPSR